MSEAKEKGMKVPSKKISNSSSGKINFLDFFVFYISCISNNREEVR
nr:hypothetical protein [Chryseobacterium sp.]